MSLNIGYHFNFSSNDSFNGFPVWRGFASPWPECDPSLVSCVQVDSGYNTYSTYTTSLMDGVGTDSQSKEPQDTHTAEEGLAHSKHTKPKVTHVHRTEVSVSLISLLH